MANMQPADMRSPFKSLPNTATRPGFAPTQTRFIKCMVVNVQLDPNGTPNFLFDVRPVSDGASTGGPDNNITDVPMLQAGFGNITDVGRSPAGIVFVPEVGSLVLCIFTGSRYYITGFFTGPSKGELTRLQDTEQRLVTFNPGIEYGLNRLIAPAKFDIPWLYGMNQGDIILGKDYSRVKVCDRGVFISGGATASLILLKTDGERLDRYSSYEARGVGLWERHNFTRGTETQADQYDTDPTLATPPDGGSVYNCQIIETSPYIPAKAPYLVFEKGHISRGFSNRGRSAIYATATTSTIQAENEAENYAVMRAFIAQPVSDQPSQTSETQSERVTSQQANELLTAAYERFDLQVDVDGSFRARAGNTSKLMKGQTPDPTAEMDYSFEYVAKTLAFIMRIGKAGANITSIIANPKQIIVHTPALIEKIDATIDTTARQSITQTTKAFILNAQSIKLNGGPVDIEKKLSVKDDVQFSKNCDVLEDVNAQKVKSTQRMVSPQYMRGSGQLPDPADGPSSPNNDPGTAPPAATGNRLNAPASSCRT